MSPLLLSLALLIAQGTTLPFGQSSTDPTNQAPATIEGFVVRTGTSTPITRARVILSPEDGSAGARTARTDGGGRFVFEDVQPGRYRIGSEREGYVEVDPDAGVALLAGAGARVNDVLVSMTPTGVISGRIYDIYGEPVVGIDVEALQFTYNAGARELAGARSTQTNDRGEYRLYWLEPGEYYVRVAPDGPALGANIIRTVDGQTNIRVESFDIVMRGGTAGVIEQEMRNLATLAFDDAEGAEDEPEPVPVYYPGTPDPEFATPVALAAGIEYSGVDLLLEEILTVSVRGQVVGDEGSLAGAEVRLFPAGRIPVSTASAPTARTGPDGRFEFNRVVPGSYVLVATGGAARIAFAGRGGGNGEIVSEFRMVGAGNFDPNRQFGRVPIEVGNADVDNVTVAMRPGFAVDGRLMLDGASEVDLDAVRVRLDAIATAESVMFGVPVQPAELHADGRFRIEGLPPRDYRVAVAGLPDGAYMARATLDGADVLTNGVRLANAPVGALNVTLAVDSGTVDARIVDRQDIPQPGVRTVLVPSQPRRGRVDLYQSTTSDGAGRVRFEDVAPGDYRIFAWDDVPSGAWTYPDFIADYEDRGAAVRVPPSGQQAVTARVIAD